MGTRMDDISSYTLLPGSLGLAVSTLTSFICWGLVVKAHQEEFLGCLDLVLSQELLILLPRQT